LPVGGMPQNAPMCVARAVHSTTTPIALSNDRLRADFQLGEGLVIHRDALFHTIDSVRHPVLTLRGALEHAQLIVGRENVVKHIDVATAPAFLKVPPDEGLMILTGHMASFITEDHDWADLHFG
jgi:hypothetical protein